jgi:hypothetical protein
MKRSESQRHQADEDYARACIPGGRYFFTMNLAERQGNGLLVRCWDSLRFIPAYCTAGYKAGFT